jgi:hypothetical protein
VFRLRGNPDEPINRIPPPTSRRQSIEPGDCGGCELRKLSLLWKTTEIPEVV